MSHIESGNMDLRSLGNSFGDGVTENINIMAEMQELNYTVAGNFSLKEGNVNTTLSSLVTYMSIDVGISHDDNFPVATVERLWKSMSGSMNFIKIAMDLDQYPSNFISKGIFRTISLCF